MKTFVLLAGLATAAPTPAADGGVTLTMQQAVDQALRTHPQVQASQAGLQAARYERNAAVGRMLPTVAVGDQQVWSHLNTHHMLDGLVGAAAAPAFLAPNAATNLLNVGASQPLLGLLGRSQRYRAGVADVRAGEAQLRAAQRDLGLEVRRQYLALFEARALADTARASERALLEQVDDAEHKLAAGALAQTDVLRRRAAAAAAKQQVLAATASEEVARAALLELLGFAAETRQVQFVEPATVETVPVPADLHALRAQAVSLRPELQASAASAHAAGLRARAERLALLPEIDAQLAYMHMDARAHLGSEQERARADAYFVGLKASWPIWQWGSSYYGQRAAYARAAQARAQAQAAERRVGSEVAQRHANLVACLGAVQAAVAETSSAEEAYRVMLATLAVDAATTSDLLQTEAAQTQARMNLVRARYELALAQVALDYATGAEG